MQTPLLIRNEDLFTISYIKPKLRSFLCNRPVSSDIIVLH